MPRRILEVQRWSRCRHCRARIAWRRGRPTHYCSSCKLQMLADDQQLGLFTPVTNACIVCRHPLTGRNPRARTCSDACRRYLARLRAA